MRRKQVVEVFKREDRSEKSGELVGSGRGKRRKPDGEVGIGGGTWRRREDESGIQQKTRAMPCPPATERGRVGLSVCGARKLSFSGAVTPIGAEMAPNRPSKIIVDHTCAGLGAGKFLSAACGKST